MNTVIILVRLSGTFRMRNPDATYLVRGAMHDMGVECMEKWHPRSSALDPVEAPGATKYSAKDSEQEKAC